MKNLHLHPDHLLLPTIHRQGTDRYSGTDSETLYVANSRRQPTSWIYREKDVSYTWNKSGYRCPEFDAIAWANSHVIMGCSYVLGIGLAYEDTIGDRISSTIGEPVVNLGVSGASQYITAYNTECLIEAGIRPKSVTIMSAHAARMTYWHQNHTYTDLLINSSANNTPPGLLHMYHKFVEDPINLSVHYTMLVNGIKARWEAAGVKCLVVQGDMGIDYCPWPQLTPRQDFARDEDIGSHGIVGHPGLRTAKHWAGEIVKLLELT